MLESPRQSAFVGRSEELGRLNAFLDTAVDGSGGICFVTGEPGAGKSTLLQGFCRQASERHPGLRVAMGDCNPQTGLSDAYLPFREILSDLTTGQSGRAAEETGGKTRHFLSGAARLFSEHGPDLIDIFLPGAALVSRVGAQAADKIRERRSSDPGPASTRQEPDQDGLDQNHIFEQYTNVLAELAAEQPLLLVVDDLHWADEASTRLLFHLSRRLAGHRVLLLGAYRVNEVAIGRAGERHPLEEPLNEIKRYRGDVWVDLQASQDVSGREFIDQLIDAESNRLDGDFREELFQRTGGHALFTAELLHFLKDREILVQDADGAWCCPSELAWEGLPARVEGVIGERVARLEPQQREWLSVAAVLGESFAAEVLAELIGEDLRDVVRMLSGPLTRQHALTRPLGFQRLGGVRLSNYEFRHNLIHRYFHDRLDEMERGLIHEDAGLAIESLFDGRHEAVAVQLARHFDRAELPEKAVVYLLMAGREARRSHAQQAARGFYERALRLIEEQDTLEDRESRQAEAIESLADIQVMEGEFSEARDRYEEARGLAVNGDRLAQVRLMRKVATTWEREHRHDEALDMLGRASARLETGFNQNDDEEMSAWITLQNAQLWLNYWRGNTDEMLRFMKALEPVIETHGSPSQRRRFYTSVSGYGNRMDRFAPSAETLAAARRTRAAAEDCELLYDRADGLFGSSFILMLAGELEEALSLMLQSLDLATRCGDRTLQARTMTYLAVLNRLRGQAQEVARWLPRADEACRALGMREYIGVLRGCESWLAWLEQDRGRARILAEKAVAAWSEHAPGYPFQWLALLVLIDCGLRDGGGPAAYAGHLEKIVSPRQAHLWNGVSEKLEAAAEAISASDAGTAEERLESALDRARQVGYL